MHKRFINKYVCFSTELVDIKSDGQYCITH